MIFRHRLVIWCLLTILNLPVSGQIISSTPIRDTADYPYWIEMMQDPEANFHSVQRAFEQYMANRDYNTVKGWKIFKRWEYINQSRVQPDGKLPPPDQVMKEYLNYLQSHPERSESGNWTIVGPSNLPVNNTGSPAGLGRINCIAFHPTSSNTLYIGSPSGGIWKTTNGGSSWTNLSGILPTLGISSILIDPDNPNILYIGTGDRDAGDAPGLGVYRSINGGVIWEPRSNGMGNRTVSMMIMHPSNSQIILAATSGGIYKTEDGGASWIRTTANSFFYKDIKFKPGNPAIVYATAYGNFYRSTNEGETWTQITTGVISGNRLVIGVSPANPNYVYLIQSKSYSQNYIYAGCLRSTNSGLSFTTRNTSPNILGWECNGSDNSSQAWYDLALEVDPGNAEILYVGGINTWKSTNGGASFSVKTHWYGDCGLPAVHADVHALKVSPLNARLYNCNDGGIYFTADGGTSWTEISSGLSIAQVYKIGQSQTSQTLVINGYQDNGTSIGSSSTFTKVIGGDGMECIIDYLDQNYRYGSIYYGDIRRSTGGNYYTIAAEGVNGITESGGWVTPYILHETNPNTMFAGYKNVWRSTNVKGAATWTKISSNETQNCQVLEQSPANLNILYVVREGQLKRTDNANSATPIWTSCSLPGGYTPTDLEAEPLYSDGIWATTYIGVFYSGNKGATWTDISGSLPFIPVNCIVCDESSYLDALYIGTQTGVFYRDLELGDWILFNTGLPAVDVRELEIYKGTNYSNRKIKAATYGRGLWSSDLYQQSTSGPCSNITQIAGCGSAYTQTYTGGGTGSWFNYGNNPCGVRSPGQEKIYSFTAPITGTYSLRVTSASGFADYMWKIGSCDPAGWSCIDNVGSPGYYGGMEWNEGATYYILLDDEDNTAGTHSFYINCPSPSCTDCPEYDFDITPAVTWNTHFSGHLATGCKTYRISVTEGYQYIFKTGCGDDAWAEYNTTLLLLDSNCEILAFNDDICELQSLIEWISGYSGFVYLRVSGSDSQSFGYYNLAYKILPSISAVPDSITFGAVPVGQYSSSKSYTVSAYNINDLLQIDPPYGDFQVSLDSLNNFVDFINLSPLNGIIADTKIFIRFSPGYENTYSDNISNWTFDNYEHAYVAVTGTGIANTVPTTLTLENVLIPDAGTECYGALQTIYVAGNNTTFIVQEGGTATFIAGQNILYLPGTVIMQGGYMLGYITSDFNFCDNLQQNATILTSLDENSHQPAGLSGSGLLIYPNPVISDITVETSSGEIIQELIIQLFNMQGDRVFNVRISGQTKYRCNLSELSPGMYVIQVIRNGLTESGKIIKL